MRVRKAVIENGKVENIIVYDTEKSQLPVNWVLIDIGTQPVDIGWAYDSETQQFTEPIVEPEPEPEPS